MPWQFATATDIGGRSEQQDRLAIVDSPEGDSHLLILADGMGGHRDGAAAAQTVVDTARTRFSAGAVEDPRSFLDGLCAEADLAIRALEPGPGGAPGSTCVMLYVLDAEAYWVHVGDSRLYHIREGEPVYRTRDHSKAQLLRDQRVAGQSGAAESANQLYMCLGGTNPVAPDFNASGVRHNDLFILCSDGFWGHVEPLEVAGRLEGVPLRNEQARDLVEMARHRGNGSGDNMSLALARWEGAASSATRRLLQGLSRWFQ